MIANGGYLGSTPAISKSGAGGIWSLNDAYCNQQAGVWPVVVPPMNVTASLALWLKADAGVLDATGSPITVDNTAVATWQDQSGNGRDATQSTSGNRPVWRSAVNGQNGYPTVYFNGSTSQMAGPWATFDPLSIYIVFKWTSGTSAGTVFTQSDATTDDSAVSPTNENWLPVTVTTGPAITYYYPATSSSTSLTQGTGISIASVSGNYNRIIHKRNGTSLSSTVNGGTAVTATQGAINRVMTRYGIGRRLLTLNVGYQGGYWAEILAYNSILSTSDENSVVAYLQAKWNVL